MACWRPRPLPVQCPGRLPRRQPCCCWPLRRPRCRRLGACRRRGGSAAQARPPRRRGRAAQEGPWEKAMNWPHRCQSRTRRRPRVARRAKAKPSQEARGNSTRGAQDPPPFRPNIVTLATAAMSCHSTSSLRAMSCRLIPAWPSTCAASAAARRSCAASASCGAHDVTGGGKRGRKVRPGQAEAEADQQQHTGGEPAGQASS